jgi:fructan beta-fructosidase
MLNRIFAVMIILLAGGSSALGQTDPSKIYHEPYRPQLHFSPKQHWTNDPNGMIYFDHTYHLFYQYYPNAIVWGPMHWGHAVSKDLIHWKELPIALYPDSLGYIFSGSAVVDSGNTSGFGKNGRIPLVAIFTHHDPKGEKAGKNNYQNQSLAYSLDGGYTWTKYSGNPVLKNPGIKDFRDPKVMWYGKEKKWIMTLATKDRITFYSSPDLKKWKKESEFGTAIGAHGGVWECPDLFSLKLNGKTYWVLIVNINPGGPNGGSATQYFIGQFDGRKFTPAETKTKWLDYGPDEYAGITWNNTGATKIFLGWMSNWEYANQVPTKTWRSAMTIPRELKLVMYKGGAILASQPIKGFNDLKMETRLLKNIDIQKRFNLSTKIGVANEYVLNMDADDLKSYVLTLSNRLNQKLIIGYDISSNQYYIDRSKSGETGFEKNFTRKSFAPRLTDHKNTRLTLIVDASSVELFADGGSTVMTAIFFPAKPYNKIDIRSDSPFTVKELNYSALKSIW